VRTCAPTARYFGDLDNPNSEVNRLISDKSGVRLLDHTGNKPQVYYLSGGAGPVVPSGRADKTKT
jgi:molybdopterin-containing oxidoreductase family iron-sulfur binding subunit